MGGHFHDVVVYGVLRPKEGAETLFGFGCDLVAGDGPVLEPETVVAIAASTAAGIGLALVVNGTGEKTDVADERIAFNFGGKFAEDWA